MENDKITWTYPILSFIRNLLGRGRGGGIGGPKWSDVIDSTLTTGNPPNLNTDTIIFDENSRPFSITIIKNCHIRLKYYENDRLIGDEYWLIEQIPFPINMTERDRELCKIYNNKLIFVLESIP